MTCSGSAPLCGEVERAALPSTERLASFEEVTLGFTKDSGALKGPGQSALHTEGMMEKNGNVAFLAAAFLVQAATMDPADKSSPPLFSQELTTQASQPTQARGGQAAGSAAKSQGAQLRVRVRAHAWSEAELGYFIDLWMGPKAQGILRSTRHDHLFPWFSEQLLLRGFRRSPAQCKEKMHALKKKFKEIVTHNRRIGQEPRTMPFYDKLASILTGRRDIAPGYTAGSGILLSHPLRARYWPMKSCASPPRETSPTLGTSRHAEPHTTRQPFTSVPKPPLMPLTATVSHLPDAVPGERVFKGEASVSPESPSLLPQLPACQTLGSKSPTPYCSSISNPTNFTPFDLGRESRPAVSKGPSKGLGAVTRKGVWSTFPHEMQSELHLPTEGMDICSAELVELTPLAPATLSPGQPPPPTVLDLDRVMMQSLAAMGEPLTKLEGDLTRARTASPPSTPPLEQIFAGPSIPSFQGFAPAEEAVGREPMGTSPPVEQPVPPEEALTAVTAAAATEPPDKEPLLTNAQQTAHLRNKHKTDRVQLARDLVTATEAAGERTYTLFREMNEHESKRQASERLVIVWSTRTIASSIRASGQLVRDGMREVWENMREVMAASDRVYERAMEARTAAIDRQTDVLRNLTTALQAAVQGHPPPSQYMPYAHGLLQQQLPLPTHPSLASHPPPVPHCVCPLPLRASPMPIGDQLMLPHIGLQQTHIPVPEAGEGPSAPQRKARASRHQARSCCSTPQGAKSGNGASSN